MKISSHHAKELAASAVDPKLAALNCESYEPGDDAIYERFFRGIDSFGRTALSRRTKLTVHSSVLRDSKNYGNYWTPDYRSSLV